MKPFTLALAYALTRLLALTYRFRPVGTEHLEQCRCSGRGGYILAIWHQNLFAGILAQTGRRHTVMVSRSHDGDPVAHVCERLGHHAVRGSSRKGGIDKGGHDAKDEMIAILCAGLPGAITVDGPKGPAKEVKPGIIDMARKASVPILPYLAIAEHYWTFNSWDRFRLPKPFSVVYVRYGAPLRVPADTLFESFAAHQGELQVALNGLESERPRANPGPD